MLFYILVTQKDEEASSVNDSATINGGHSSVDKTKGAEQNKKKNKI